MNRFLSSPCSHATKRAISSYSVRWSPKTAIIPPEIITNPTHNDRAFVHLISTIRSRTLFHILQEAINALEEHIKTFDDDFDNEERLKSLNDFIGDLNGLEPHMLTITRRAGALEALYLQASSKDDDPRLLSCEELGEWHSEYLPALVGIHSLVGLESDISYVPSIRKNDIYTVSIVGAPSDDHSTWAKLQAEKCIAAYGDVFEDLPTAELVLQSVYTAVWTLTKHCKEVGSLIGSLLVMRAQANRRRSKVKSHKKQDTGTSKQR